jgi:ACT domain-containing protein
MDEKIQAISLGSILSLLKQNIINSDAGISEHNFKSKLQIMFSAYMHQNFLIAHNSFMNSYIQNKQGTLHEELDGYSRTFFIISTIDASIPVQLLGMITLRMNNLDISSLEKPLKKKLIYTEKARIT